MPNCAGENKVIQCSDPQKYNVCMNKLKNESWYLTQESATFAIGPQFIK